MTPAEQQAPTLPAPPHLAQCPCCGSVYTRTEFFALATFKEWRIEGDCLGYAQCSGCFSSMTIYIAPEPTGPAS